MATKRSICKGATQSCGTYTYGTFRRSPLDSRRRCRAFRRNLSARPCPACPAPPAHLTPSPGPVQFYSAPNAHALPQSRRRIPYFLCVHAGQCTEAELRSIANAASAGDQAIIARIAELSAFNPPCGTCLNGCFTGLGDRGACASRCNSAMAAGATFPPAGSRYNPSATTATTRHDTRCRAISADTVAFF